MKAIYNPSKLVMKDVELGPNKIKLIDGTITPKPDYDDAWFYELTKISTNIYDIGANIGFSSIIANLNQNIKNILLVDPNPEALSMASKNLIQNNLAYNCNFYVGFVGEKSDEEIPFYTISYGAAGSMYKGHAKSAASLNKFFTVKTITMDDLFLIYKYTPDLVKIDVEGAEHLVLNGASNIAGLQKTRFLVEMHSPDELPMDSNARLILDWCSINNYSAWYMKEESLLENSEQIAHRGRCHLLLQPKGWEYPPEIIGIKQGQHIDY